MVKSNIPTTHFSPSIQNFLYNYSYNKCVTHVLNMVLMVDVHPAVAVSNDAGRAHSDASEDAMVAANAAIQLNIAPMIGIANILAVSDSLDKILTSSIASYKLIPFLSSTCLSAN